MEEVSRVVGISGVPGVLEIPGVLAVPEVPGSEDWVPLFYHALMVIKKLKINFVK